MKKQTGVWIDGKKAVIVFLKDDAQQVLTIHSSILTRVRIPGEGRAFTRFGMQFSAFEKKRERRMARERNEFLKLVVAELKDVDDLVIFGPAELKVELEKYIREKTALSACLRDVKEADRMTENQIVALVKTYYRQIKELG